MDFVSQSRFNIGIDDTGTFSILYSSLLISLKNHPCLVRRTTDSNIRLDETPSQTRQGTFDEKGVELLHRNITRTSVE